MGAGRMRMAEWGTRSGECGMGGRKNADGRMGNAEWGGRGGRIRRAECGLRKVAGTKKLLRRGSGRDHAADMKKNPLETRTKRFALDVIKFVASLKPSRPAKVIARQVLKSGTSVGANYREATRAESRSDFIHKLAICEKEAAETEYWLELLAESRLAPLEQCDELLRECSELLAIIVASIRTAKSRL